jgi:hypothetical protein
VASVPTGRRLEAFPQVDLLGWNLFSRLTCSAGTLSATQLVRLELFP